MPSFGFRNDFSFPTQQTRPSPPPTTMTGRSSGSGRSRHSQRSPGHPWTASPSSPLVASPSPSSSPGVGPPESVRLSCLSVDGQFVHTLHVKNRTIESLRLPPQQQQQDQRGSQDGDNHEVRVQDGWNERGTSFRSPSRTFAPGIRVIVTPLPELVRLALDVDPPLEVLALPGDNSGGGRYKGTLGPGRQIRCPTRGGSAVAPPAFFTLCLYTSKSVFVMEISADKENSANGTTVEGRVEVVHEPFEQVLMFGAGATTVVRVRPAPDSRRHGCGTEHVLMCPGHSLAALVHNPEIREYSLVLSHGGLPRGGGTGGSPLLTTPVVFGSELETEEDAIVDFCFVQSRALSLLSSITVMFLKASSDVAAASPVVFHGSIVAAPVLDEALSYLASQLQSFPQASAAWRRARISQQYIRDVFRRAPGSLFYAAALLPPASCPPSASWQVQLQGPVLFAPRPEEGVDEDDTPPSPALTLEPFGRLDPVGIAVARQGRVDVGVLSPTAVLPRFVLESGADRTHLDDDVCTKSAWIDRVAFLGVSSSSAASRRWSHPSSSVALLPDPMMDTLLHYASSRLVATVSTTAIQETSRRLKGKRAGPTRTAAWSCLTATTWRVQGVVIDSTTNETQLVARLANGAIETVSVAEAQIRHQVQDALLATSSSSSASPGGRQPLLLTDGGGGAAGDVSAVLSSRLEATHPLSDLLDPLLRRIQKGLGDMSKVVGSSTAVADATPDQLAVALELYRRTDEELALPLLELKRVVLRRRKRLKEMAERQLEQIASLARSVSVLKSGLSALAGTMERIESNGATLSQRSSAVLLASQALVPTLSQAEYEYFQDVKRIGNKTTSLEHKVKRAVESAETVRSKLQAHPLSFSLTKEQVTALTAMLDEQASTLTETQAKMSEAQTKLTDLASSLNLH